MISSKRIGYTCYYWVYYIFFTVFCFNTVVKKHCEWASQFFIIFTWFNYINVILVIPFLKCINIILQNILLTHTTWRFYIPPRIASSKLSTHSWESSTYSLLLCAYILRLNQTANSLKGVFCTFCISYTFHCNINGSLYSMPNTFIFPLNPDKAPKSGNWGLVRWSHLSTDFR